MNEHTQGKLSSLARRLEPFVTRWVHEILGEGRHTPLPGMTYIHGTGFPYIDESESGRGQGHVGDDHAHTIYGDFQLNRENDEEITQGDSQKILGGQNNGTYWRGDSVGMGNGSYAVDDIVWSMGNKFSIPGDGQTMWMCMFGEEYYGAWPSGGSWTPLFGYYLYDTPSPLTMLFNCYFVGHNVYDGSKCWHFMLDAMVTWNDDGAPTVVWQNSTEIYSDGDGVDVRINPDYEYGILYDAYSEVYQGIRWFVHARISEISF